MPVYNGEEYISETIDSVLKQTFVDFELIIINDASNDRSKEIISSYEDKRIVLIENSKNTGQINSVNKGIKLSKTNFIARVDQDDLFISNKLETQYDFLNKNPDIAVVGTWAFIINSNGNQIRKLSIPSKNNQMINILLNSNPLFHPSVLMRKEVILKMGLYSLKYQFTEDYNLWCKIATSGYKLANIPKFLIKYREHPNQSSSKNQTVQFKNALKIRRKYFMQISDELFKTKKHILEGFNKRELSDIAYTCSEISAQKKKYIDSMQHLNLSLKLNKLNLKSLLMMCLLRLNEQIYYKFVIYKNIYRSKLVE